MNLPTISIIIPTLNSAKTLAGCLDSILIQDYPKDRLEIIIADGGSRDSTLEIINSKLSIINYQLLSNPLKTGEAGKAVGVKQAKNEIIALIDSDNVLPRSDWLKLMVEPFQDNEIIASEPLYYTYRPTDGYITRYCALLGMNDPLCLFLGNYDRYCTLTGKWTEVRHKEEDKGNYLKIEFPALKSLPTIGANGFCIKRDVLLGKGMGDYLFDIDILQDILKHDQYKIAKVKIGIIHIFSGNVRIFVKKQTRRICDYNYYKSLGLRKYAWGGVNKIKILYFIISCISYYLLVIQAIRGYLKKRDLSWFFHPIACWFTFIAYGIGTVRNIISVCPQNRTNWGQG